MQYVTKEEGDQAKSWSGAYQGEIAIDRQYKGELKHLLHFRLQPSLTITVFIRQLITSPWTTRGKISGQKSSDMSQLESR